MEKDVFVSNGYPVVAFKEQGNLLGREPISEYINITRVNLVQDVSSYIELNYLKSDIKPVSLWIQKNDDFGNFRLNIEIFNKHDDLLWELILQNNDFNIFEKSANMDFPFAILSKTWKLKITPNINIARFSLYVQSVYVET